MGGFAPHIPPRGTAQNHAAPRAVVAVTALPGPWFAVLDPPVTGGLSVKS
jgi:hypothetical protein